MSLILLLCTLLQAFSTCSLVNIKEQPQSPSYEQSVLENLKTAFLETTKDFQSPILFLTQLVETRDAAERCWSMCLDKMSAYSHNQDFFKNTLPAFIDQIEKYPKPHPRLRYTADTIFMEMNIFCELRSFRTYSEDLTKIRNFFNDGCDPFEGLSDEFLTLAADYMRSTVNIRKLDLTAGHPSAFKDIQHQSVNKSILQKRLVVVLMHLKGLVKGLHEADPAGAYRRLSKDIKALSSTMVPANKVLLEFLEDLLLKKISLLAEKASESISAPCNRLELTTTAKNLIASIEAVTIPLYRAHLDLDRAVAERRGRAEIGWNNFLESLFACESILVKPNLKIVRNISEKLSELISILLDIFLTGEDELWTLGLHAKLEKAEALWNRALRALASLSDIKELIPCSKYICYIRADLTLILHIITVVEKLEESLAFDRSTRKKLVAFWREAQALVRLLRSLSILKLIAKHFELTITALDDASMKRLLSDFLDDSISAAQRLGNQFQLGTYHHFINELPDHQEAIAQLLKTFSDELSHAIVDEATSDAITTIFLPLKSSIFTPLKQSLEQLFISPPQPIKPQTVLSRPADSKDKRSKRRGSKPRGNAKLCKAAAPNASVSKMQAFVRTGPQYVNVSDAGGGAEDSLKLLNESLEDSWTVVKAPRNRQNFGSLATQSAQEVLRRFASKPRGWDGIPPVDPRDMRSDRQKVKIATFNVEWLFLFDLFTEKLNGKIKWKSLEEAWDHIKEVARAIREINADIICLCEVQDLRILSILVELLPGLNYRAYLIPNHDSLGQNVGILTRVDTHVSISRIDEPFFSKNIVFHLKLDNGRGDLVDLVFTGVHLISSTAEADHIARARHREDQAKALKKHLALNYDTSGETIHFVLGDFNMVDQGLCSTPFADDEEALKVVKHGEFNLYNAMGHGGAPNNLLSRSVCHIFASHPTLTDDSQLFDLNDGSTPYRLERVSDHSPVVTTIRLPNYSQ